MQVNNLYYDFSHTFNKIPAFCLRFLKIADLTVFSLFFIQHLLSPCGDTEEHSGPKYLSLTFCHWNLNGHTAHDSSKISLLQAYITQHNYDICLTDISYKACKQPKPPTTSQNQPKSPTTSQNHP